MIPAVRTIRTGINSLLLHKLRSMLTTLGVLFGTSSVIAMLAPYVNSYRRYVRDNAAPINLEWGIDNRTCAIVRAIFTIRCERG